jgi:hypothetical protein
MKRRPLLASLVSSLAAILLLAAGCGEQSPTASRLEPTELAAARQGVGRRARVLKARYHAGRFSRTLGPDGGTLSFRIGRLIVPPGALSGRTRITAYVNGEDLAVEFQPHGLAFHPGHEPILEINFRKAPFPDSDLHIQYVDSLMNLLESLPTSTDPESNVARAPIAHFSLYCLAD